MVRGDSPFERFARAETDALAAIGSRDWGRTFVFGLAMGDGITRRNTTQYNDSLQP